MDTSIIEDKGLGIYIRLDLQKQEDGITLSLQREAIERYIRVLSSNNDFVFTEDMIYQDIDDELNSLNRLKHDIEIGKINTIVTYTIKNLSSDVKDFLSFLEFLMIKNNADLISAKEHINTYDAMGKHALTMFLSIGSTFN